MQNLSFISFFSVICIPGKESALKKYILYKLIARIIMTSKQILNFIFISVYFLRWLIAWFLRSAFIDWKNHGSEYYECSRYKENPSIAQEANHVRARHALEKYLHYYGVILFLSSY